MSDGESSSPPIFGNYEVLETIGQGGMGIVYRAVDKALGRTVALKILKEDLRTHQQVVARFQREAEAFATLDHPHIVHIFSVGSVGRIPFIAMEYVNGESLSEVMRRERKLEWKLAFEIGEQIASALACAHESGIIHRDIKPGNILVDDKKHSYVTDFGIAKVLTAETQLTVEGSRLGTPQYMSPERCQNHPVVPQSDLYSLGVLLFQMLTGRLPFEAASPVELVREIVTEAPKRVREFEPEVPEDADRLVAYLLEKKPEDRPATGDEWARLSARVREGLPLEESDSGFSSSLKSMREGLSTPTTGISGFDSSNPTTEFGRLVSRFPWLIPWQTWSSRARYWTGVGACMVLAFLMGLLATRPDQRLVSSALLQQMGRPVSTWVFGSSPALVSRDAFGLERITFQGIAGEVTRCVWRDSDVYLVYEQGTSFKAMARFRTKTGDADWIRLRSEPSSLNSNSVFLGPTEDGFLFARGYPAPELFLVGQSIGSNWREQRLSGALGRIPRSSDYKYVRGSNDSACVAWKSQAGWNLSALYSDGIRDYQVPERVSEIPWYTVDGRARVVIAACEAGTDGLEIRRWDEARKSGRLLASGRFVVAEGAFNDRHGSVVLAEETHDSGWQIKTLNTYTGTSLTELGSGRSAMWHPDANGVLLFAEDENGKLQAWAAQNEVPYARLQLTFDSDGVEPRGWISPDGRLLAVPAANERTGVMLIDIGMDALEDQGLILEPR